VNKKRYSSGKRGVRVIERSQAKGVKPKERGRKLRSGVNGQSALNQKGLKLTSVKQGLCILNCSYFFLQFIIGDNCERKRCGY
jgi:hypothetical protein